MCYVVGMLEGRWPTHLSLSPTLLTSFDSCSFRPHGIIRSFPVQLGGKTVCVEVEVVDALLDYNLFLGRSWTYAMQVVFLQT
jgi:hypothetical protein